MKTKTAYVVRYNSNSHEGMKTAGKNLRTYAAARRGAKMLKRLGVQGVYVASLTVSADTILRK